MRHNKEETRDIIRDYEESLTDEDDFMINEDIMFFELISFWEEVEDRINGDLFNESVPVDWLSDGF